MTEWFDIKLYREAVEPLMNERMRKRLVNRESPDTRVLRESMRTASEHLDYLDYLLDHRRWLAGPGLSLADFTAAAHLSVIDYLGAERGIAVDHRHAVDRLIEIFDDRLRADQRDALIGLDHHRRLARRIQVDELVPLLPRVLAHQLMADALLREDKPNLS